MATEAILKEWAKMPDMEAHLITAAVGSEMEKIHVGGNVYVHRLPIGKNPAHLHSQSMKDILVYTVKSWFYLRGFVNQETKKQKFDATLAFFTIPCGFVAYLLKIFYKIPYAVSLRGADVPGFSEKYDKFYLVAKPLVRFLWKRAEKVIPNSSGIMAFAKQTRPTQAMEIIENGVDTELFCPKNEGRPSEYVLFLSTSRLTPRKGIHFLIEAFSQALQQSAKPIKLQLIGEGEQKETLEARVRELGIENNVEFLGRVEHGLLPKYYQQAHIFLLPSKNEGMSNATLEALASGLPLVVSGTGGMIELVTNGANGFFIDPENIETFAQKLVALANAPEKIIAFGNESRRRAELRAWGKVAQNFRIALEKSIKK